MQFRTKIWMLPLSAAIIFLVGVAVSFLAGARTSASLAQLRKVEGPALEGLQRVDRNLEQIRLILQTAAAEGDADRLKDAEAVVGSTREVLSALAVIEGKQPLSAELRTHFDAYQRVALEATTAMLKRAEMGDRIQQMQSAQSKLEELLKTRTEEAVKARDASATEAERGVQAALWINLATAAVVLFVIAVASRLIVTSVWRDLGDEPAMLLSLTQRIAQGDLQLDEGVQANDGRSLQAGLHQMAAQLREMVGTIRQATDALDTASTEIANGNNDLSVRTEQTAMNLQSTASSVEELTGSVRRSADSAQQVNQLAIAATASARRGGDIVDQVVENMAQINTASQKISEIIGVIDGIAFQTNILALNAAVEAARAGEQGRGFAVVASEVRLLAHRSAQAAREIKGLIGASSEKIESGAQLVQEAGTAMREIVTGVQRVTDIIGEINAATEEQRGGIGQVNEAITNLDHMTQQNAALVEQSAAAASSMREQASSLSRAVAVFRLQAAPITSL